MEERLAVLWLESPVKLWLNGTKAHNLLSHMFVIMQSVCLMSHAVKLLLGSSAVLVELLPCSPHPVSVTGEVAAAAPGVCA